MEIQTFPNPDDPDKERFFKAVLNEMNAIVAIHEIGDKLKPVWINEAVTKITGFKPEEYIDLGGNAPAFSLHPEDRKVIKDLENLFSSTDKEYYHGVQRVKAKGDRWIWLYTNIRILERKPNRLPRKIIVVAIEIDDQLNSQKQFNELLKEKAQLKNEIKLMKLTSRQQEILKYIANGYTDREIAEKLFLSTNTVKTHRKNILRSLNFRNSAMLSAFATECGLV